ncbi:MAG: hypothetical protein ACYTAN_01940 [Planctomycetota bacterium]|jgi:hypothetical protein
MQHDVPSRIIRSDRVLFTFDDADYLAVDYKGLFAIAAGTGKLDLESASDVDVFDFEITTGQTAAMVAGLYPWSFRVEARADETHIYTLATGSLEVVQSVVDMAETPVDPRGHIERLLDAVRAALEGRATKDQESYSIAGRSLSRIPLPDLRDLEKDYAARLVAQQQRERRAAGKPAGNQVRAVF